LVADKKLLSETSKSQVWERIISDWMGNTYWYRVKPYDKKIPKTRVYGFKSDY